MSSLIRVSMEQYLDKAKQNNTCVSMNRVEKSWVGRLGKIFFIFYFIADKNDKNGIKSGDFGLFLRLKGRKLKKLKKVFG